eukprot:5396693-Prymnesium_polylepis.1
MVGSSKPILRTSSIVGGIGSSHGAVALTIETMLRGMADEGVPLPCISRMATRVVCSIFSPPPLLAPRTRCGCHVGIDCSLRCASACALCVASSSRSSSSSSRCSATVASSSRRSASRFSLVA